MQQQLKVEREKETGWKKIVQQELKSSSFPKQDKEDRKKNILILNVPGSPTDDKNDEKTCDEDKINNPRA